MTNAEGSPKVGGIGVKFIIDIGEDVSDASTTNLIFQAPNGTITTNTATVENDNYLTYTTTDADELDAEGVWLVIAEVVMSGFTGSGETVKVLVRGRFG